MLHYYKYIYIIFTIILDIIYIEGEAVLVYSCNERIKF